MNRLLLLLLGALALLALAFFCTRHHVADIQTDLQTRALAALSEADLDWVEVALDGRNLTLTGIAPDLSARQRAATLAEVDGVYRLDNRIAVADGSTAAAEPDPYRASAQLESGRLSLSGDIPNQASADALRASVVQQNTGEVTVDLAPRADAPEGWEATLRHGLMQLAQLNSGRLELVDRRLSVSGTAADQTQATQIEQALRTALPEGYSLDVSIGHPPLEAQPVAVELDQCQARFDTLLTDNKIQFASNQAVINAASFPLLQQLAETAGACPGARIEIAGHTDSTGNEDYNLSLSQRRAAAVVAWLTDNGIDGARLSARGYGESQPIDDNTTRAGRANNRRIEFEIQNN